MNHTGRRMILECSEAKDPLATLTILGCVRAREKWALDIPKIDIASARRHLQTLAYEDQNPDAMILVGLDLRAKRNDAAARVLFEKAMRKVSEGEMLDVNSGTTGDKLPFKVDNVRGHDLLPIPAPWIALGNLLLEQAEPDLEAAKAVFYTGATKADDPLAYFYLAECGDMYSDEWLEYMTKAASSGHPDAMFHMGNFYAQSKQEATQSVGLTGHRHLKAIDSFKSWKSGPGLTARLPGLPDDLPLSGREAMAFEWYFLGFVDAHRSATLGLARLLRRKSAWWAAVEVLKEILEDRDKDEENTVAKREALELTKVWQDEEKKEGLTFTKDVLAAVDSKKR
ncbi:uncharacterized protein BDZ99DRAFT_167785 [Mytilinidion resinicola]|uniref:HCP-like protein n=1 Tax=Mytilinidion resinicola TaxID=574789 RepID=A0A6A6Y4M7_9PEZI|nr:uncharacterized protein BDZ99DRAFT_167785 [Mytilinidion resinicola]KAF2803610.1 hypothetical protein BDZ99DRAFT_167785 [Mytilinidion resinicola]